MDHGEYRSSRPHIDKNKKPTSTTISNIPTLNLFSEYLSFILVSNEQGSFTCGCLQANTGAS